MKYFPSVDTASTLEGGKGPVAKNGPAPKEMPSYKKITDRKIADVLTFVRNSWGNKATAVTPRDVSSVGKMLEK